MSLRHIYFTAILLFGCISMTNSQWVSAYYRASSQNYLLPDSIDYGAITHLMHFQLVPNANGHLDTTLIDTTKTKELLAKVPTAIPVLITIGGDPSYMQNWLNGTATAALRDTLVHEIATFLSRLTRSYNSRQYAGVDVDWEELNTNPNAKLQYPLFIKDLYDTLHPKGKMITTAISFGDVDVVSSSKNYLDQINIMTYDFGYGNPTWFNNALFDRALSVGSNSYGMVSADTCVRQARNTTNNIPANEIGIGIKFNGYRSYSGTLKSPQSGSITNYAQIWDTSSLVRQPKADGDIPYYQVMSSYYSGTTYRNDDYSQSSKPSFSSYLTNTSYLNSDGSTGYFLSYDDQRTIYRKLNYTQNTGINGSPKIGGVILWELNGGWRSTLPAGIKDSLLKAVKASLLANQNKTLSTTGLSGNGQRKLTRTPSGLLHLVFESNGEIFYRNSTDNGSTWVTINILSDGSGKNAYPCLTERNGSIYSVWERSNGSGLDVVYTYSTNAGSTWLGAPVSLTSTTTEPRPVIQATSPSKPFYSFIVYRASNGIYSKRTNVTAPLANQWYTQTVTSSLTANNPSVALTTSTDSLVLVTDDNNVIYAQTYDTTWKTRTNISNGASLGGLIWHSRPSVATTGNNSKFVAWEGTRVYRSFFSEEDRGVVVVNQNLNPSQYWEFNSGLPYYQYRTPMVSGHDNGNATVVWARDINLCAQKTYSSGAWSSENVLFGSFDPVISINNGNTFGGSAYVLAPQGTSAPYTISGIGGPFQKSRNGSELHARKVNLTDNATGSVEILVEQDGRPVDDELRGTDLTTDKSGNTIVKITAAKMYNLVRNNTASRHVLTVRSTGKPFEAYVLTFTPVCEM